MAKQSVGKIKGKRIVDAVARTVAPQRGPGWGDTLTFVCQEEPEQSVEIDPETLVFACDGLAKAIEHYVLNDVDADTLVNLGMANSVLVGMLRQYRDVVS